MTAASGVRDCPLPRLHVVTDDAVLSSPEFVERAVGVIEAGGPSIALHLRGPRTTGRALFDRAFALLPVARAVGAPLLVNDRVDVALAAGTDGVHLGARSLPVADTRALVGSDRWVGVSVHDDGGLARARDEGADFAFVGHVFDTPSHPGAVPLGAGGLARILAAAPGLRALGIGGIGPARVAEVAAVGAWGVAALGGVWRRPDPVEAVLDYLSVLEQALGPSTERR